MNLISRKIEEKNEKIVRGLLKLPPNRRCINCDSLGPQYVCTNFWTFICTTCSGIHREFTHRVKSISMSRFTTVEVEALQNGGNQRARELYLKGWDFQRQRLPSSSNVEKIREFIKNAYVDKKYVAGIAAKVSDTPTESQSPKSHEEHRRASSYHSYSQSPPYDHQYEERKYGKRAPVLTRKPGSERSLHIEKPPNFVYSPTRMTEKANDNRYTNDGSISRHSLHSESSGGDIFRSDIMSPSSYSTHSFSSHSAQDSIEWKTSTFMEEDARRDVNKIPRPERAPSTGSFGSYGFSPCSQVTNAPEHDRTVAGYQSHMLAGPSSMDKHTSHESYSTLDFFANQVVSQPLAASSTVDLFQLPTTSASTFTIPHASTFDSHMMPKTFQSSTVSPPPVNYFGNNSPDLLLLTKLEHASSEITMAKNEGWATFDTVCVDNNLQTPPVNEPHKSDKVSPFSQTTHNEPLQCDHDVQAHSVFEPCRHVLSPWSDVMQQQAFIGTAPSQTQWSAFDDIPEDPVGHTRWDNIPQKVDPHYAMSNPSADSNHFMNPMVTEGLKDNAASGLISGNRPPFSSSFYPQTSSDLNPDNQPYSVKYTNPFDLSFDSDSDANKEFLNMNSLRAALPSESAPIAFPGEFADPWPSHYPVATLPASAVQASIPYVAAQSQSSHFTDASPHGPLTSIGGNPFA